jgi:hypothetical protein|uniref:Uncharacterized protein n=1 Tax=Sipha flava TaxID=143950 RepID=A0A2S2QLL9_9HEMI
MFHYKSCFTFSSPSSFCETFEVGHPCPKPSLVSILYHYKSLIKKKFKNNKFKKKHKYKTLEIKWHGIRIIRWPTEKSGLKETILSTTDNNSNCYRLFSRWPNDFPPDLNMTITFRWWKSAHFGVLYK